MLAGGRAGAPGTERHAHGVHARQIDAVVGCDVGDQRDQERIVGVGRTEIPSALDRVGGHGDHTELGRACRQIAVGARLEGVRPGTVQVERQRCGCIGVVPGRDAESIGALGAVERERERDVAGRVLRGACDGRCGAAAVARSRRAPRHRHGGRCRRRGRRTARARRRRHRSGDRRIGGRYRVVHRTRGRGRRRRCPGVRSGRVARARGQCQRDDDRDDGRDGDRAGDPRATLHQTSLAARRHADSDAWRPRGYIAARRGDGRTR